MKRGQVTIFIVFGILILFVFGLIAYLNTSDNTADKFKREVEVPEEIKPVETFYATCVKQVGREGILELSLQGGYYELPQYVFNSEFGPVPYFFYMGENIMESTDNFEEQLGLYMEDNLPRCLGNFSEIKGYDVEMGELEPEVNVVSNRVIINFNQVAKVKAENNNFNLNFPSYVIEANVRDMYKVADRVIENTKNAPKRINMTLLFELMDEYNFQIDTMSNEDDKVVYVIQDENNRINDVPHMFLFAKKVYAGNSAPVIKTEEIEAKVGENIDTYIEAEDQDMDNLQYYSTGLFFVNRNSGYIDYIPTQEDVGEHNVNVSVYDGEEFVSKEIRVVVNE